MNDTSIDVSLSSPYSLSVITTNTSLGEKKVGLRGAGEGREDSQVTEGLIS